MPDCISITVVDGIDGTVKRTTSSRNRVPLDLVLIVMLAWSLSGCGGGSGAAGPQPDFTITVAGAGATSLSVGTTGAPIMIGVTSIAGFSGSVTISLAGLPVGVTTAPVSPFLVAAGSTQPVSFTASTAAVPGDATVTLSGIASGITHTAMLTLHVLPRPDFSIGTDVPAISVGQGAIGGSVKISIGAVGTFVDPVVVAVASTPTGVETIPATPFTVAAGSSQTVQFHVSTTAGASTYPLTLIGTSGSLTHTVTLSLIVTPLVGPGLPRINYFRTDAQPSAGVYDQRHHQVFVTVPELNRVDVFSTVRPRRIASLSVARPVGLELTPDGSTVVIGSGLEQLVFVDTSTLKVTQRMPFGPVSAVVGTVSAPTVALATSNGKYLIVAHDLNSTGVALLQWDPSSGAIVDRTLETNGIANIVRSADYSTVVVVPETSGGVAVYDAATDRFTTSTAFNAGAGTVSVSPDGSQFALIDPQNLTVLDRQLRPLFQRSLAFSAGSVYSPDGKRLYVADSSLGYPAIDVYDTATFALLGQCPSPPLATVNPYTWQSSLYASDELGTVFGAADYGLTFSDVSAPTVLTVPAPQAYYVLPAHGAVGALTPVHFATNQPRPGGNAFFGDTLAASISTDAQSGTAPPLPTPGPVSVVESYPDGWATALPDGFTYGPTIEYMDPSGGPTAGGTQIELLGYGIDIDPTLIRVTIGGQPATVVNTSPPTLVVTPFPYPLLRLVVKVPPGVAGLADVTVTTPDGSATWPQAFEYVATPIVVPLAGTLAQAVIDTSRRRVYISNESANHIEVIALDTGEVLPPLPSGPAPAGLTITPDAAKLLVANFGDATVSVINLTDATAVTASVRDPANTVGDPRPLRVAALSNGTAFIAMSETLFTGCVSTLRQLDLATMQVVTRTDTQITCATDGPVLSASPDGARAVFSSFNGSFSAVGIAEWSAATDTFHARLFAGAVDLSQSNGGAVSIGPFVLDTNLSEIQAPGAFHWLQPTPGVTGAKILASGSLIYQPWGALSWGQGVGIWDAHAGRSRLQIVLPEAYAAQLDNLAIDPDGRTIAAITASGVTILHLPSVPLGIGWLEPFQVTTAATAPVTIHGSGFLAGTTINIDGTGVPATFLDGSTLSFAMPPLSAGPKQIRVTNPNGDTYALDAALSVQP